MAMKNDLYVLVRQHVQTMLVPMQLMLLTERIAVFVSVLHVFVMQLCNDTLVVPHAPSANHHHY
jgi:hypothetical protein